MLDLRRLRLLRELKLRGTLADVAAALNYSPSSVSQQLALLEKEVGDRYADELVVTSVTHRHDDRLRSHELLAKRWGLR